MAIPTYEGNAINTASMSNSVSVDISGIDGGSPPSDGDLLLASVTIENSSPFSDEYIKAPDKWHSLGNAHNDGRDAIFWKIRESGDSNTVQFSWAPTDDVIACIHCIRGADQARPIARQSLNHQNSSTYDWLAETTPVADCLAIASAHMTTDNRSGATPASGWTERIDTEFGNYLTIYTQTQGFPTQGTNTGTASVTIPGVASDYYVAHMILIQPQQTPVPKDIRIACGNLLSPTSTGNQDITGLGFDCKALIIFSAHKADDSASPNIEYVNGIGADDGISASGQRCVGLWHTSSSTSAGWSRNGEIVALYYSGNSTLGSPNLEAIFSRITDGFRLNWSAVDTSGVLFNYIAFGGNDFRAIVGSKIGNASPVNTLPWRPDAVNVIGQNVTTDADQIRTTYGSFCNGWIDCQSGAQFSVFPSIDNAGNAYVTFRDSAFYSKSFFGSLTYDFQFSQTLSNGWSWFDSSTDYFFYLAMYFGGSTHFPYQVEIIKADTSGVNGADQPLPSFGFGQTYTTKKLIHSQVCRDGTGISGQSGGFCEGHTKFSYETIHQDCLAFAKTSGNVSERRRKLNDAILMHSSGDLDVPGKVGRIFYPNTIDWSTNNIIGHLIGLFTLGFIGQEYTRSITDSVSVSDTIFVELSYSRTISDSISVEDSTQRVHYANRSITDSVDVTDQLDKEHYANRSEEDTVSVTDQLDKEYYADKKINDSLDVLDSIQRIHYANRSITDNVDVTDQTQRDHYSSRVVTDSVDVTDQLKREYSANKITNDTIGVVDQILIFIEYNRVENDSVSVSDQIKSEPEFFRNVYDSIFVTDQNFAATRYNRTANDLIGVIDQIQREHDSNRQISDTISVSDQLSIEFSTNINDNINVIDQVKASVYFGRIVSDSVYAYDQLDRSHDASRNISDSVSVLDQIYRTTTHERSVSDTVSVSDNLETEAWYFRYVPGVEPELYQVPIPDVIFIEDEIIASTQYLRSIDDSIDTSDQILVETFRKFGDSLIVTDTLSVEMEYQRILSDSIDVYDSVEKRMSIEISIDDSVSTDYQLSVESWYSRQIEDAISVADQILSEFFRLEKNVFDVVNTDDELIVEFTKGAYMFDSVEVTDELTVELLFISPDSIEVVDQIISEVWYSRDLFDSIETEDIVFSDDQTLIIHGSDDGINYGPVDIHTVSPTGPVTMSGGKDCYPIPTGFVLEKGDYVQCRDSIELEMVYSITVNDSVEAIG